MNSDTNRRSFPAEELLDSSDSSILNVVTHGPAPEGEIPLTAEMLTNGTSGDAFGMTEDAGMGWDPAALAGPQFVMLSTMGGIRASDGKPVALGHHTGNFELGLALGAAADEFKQAGAVPYAAYCSDPWVDQPAQPMPEGGPEGWWDVWTNSAPMRPYHSAIHHGWNRWGDYDAGGRCFGVSGWGTHSYDQAQRAIGTSDTGPVEILLEEPVTITDTGKFEEREIGEDETGQPYYRLAKLIGPRAKVRMWFANGVEMRCHLDGDRGPGLGCIVVGEKGKIEVNRDKITSNPAEVLMTEERPKTLPELGLPETSPHVKDFIDCIKTRETATADVAFAHRSTSICNLINIVREVGLVAQRLKWDPEAEQFTNCDEANQNRWMTRPRRKGYELPKIG